MEITFKINDQNYQSAKYILSQLQAAVLHFENQHQAPADDWPMSIDDLPKRQFFWYINNLGDAKKADVSGKCCHTPGQYDSEADAKSAVAFSELSRLIRHINKGWVPDWANTKEEKHFVQFLLGPYERPQIAGYATQFNKGRPDCLFFKNKEDRDRSIETHRQLWLDYFQVTE